MTNLPHVKLSVPDMSCGHCKASVTEALSALPSVREVNVDLTTREVTVAGSTAAESLLAESLLAALTEIGFPARIIATT
ncbi:heavy-metal-associated domain-containing protein [Cypionkella sinensis]|uniref:Heavy-metal-associated domain-containing protein n=1 Tax=Cypionkella sinensis TaxID=1756043 RepID=A0ABV7IUU7_9RHOB